MKTCSRCGVPKSLSEFYQRRASPDGLNRVCKVCDLSEKAQRRELFKSRTDAEVAAAAAARGAKTCATCTLRKSMDMFPLDRGRPDGRGSHCLPCSAAKTAADRARQPEVYRMRGRADFKKNRETYRNQKLRQHFGITLIEYRVMLAQQNGVCAICEKPETSTRGGRVIDLAVDHCHVTGKVRQLLCAACNKGVGYFRDSPDLLRRAALYIETHMQDQLRESPPA